MLKVFGEERDESLRLKSNVSGEILRQKANAAINWFTRNNLNGSLTFENWQFAFKANLQNLIALSSFRSRKHSDCESDEMVIFPDHKSFLVVLFSFRFKLADEHKIRFDKIIDNNLSNARLRARIILAILTLTNEK
ncbi:MAG: hypothetical protein ACTS42_01020 [Candidatus Hodgkinia cicadicola]